MAKITQKGMWIKISSLKGADKENYIISNVCLIIGCIAWGFHLACLLYTSPSPRDAHESRMPSSA